MTDQLQALLDRHEEADAKLSPRRRRTVELIAEGKTSVQIAKALGLSVKTVEAHRSVALGRIGARNAAGATAWLFRLRLLRLCASGQAFAADALVEDALRRHGLIP